MEGEVHQDQAVTLGVVHKLVDEFERDYQSSEIEEKRDSVVDQTVFILVVLLVVLRGEARTYFAESRRNTTLSHDVLPPRGRFKRETGETFHFVVVTARNDSGLSVGKWMERGIASRKIRGLTQGYLFISSPGGMMRSKDLEVDILDRITRI